MASKALIDKIHLPTWLVALLALIFIARIPSFFEPFHYGDEMIYLNLGNAIKKGLVLYRDIHDNKPPLLYFLAALAGNVFWFRAILAAWMMATTVFFWKLANILSPKNQKIVQGATVTFAILTTLPLLEGQTANAELFALLPTILAFLLLLGKRLKHKKIFLAGVLFSTSTLFKVPAAFDIGAIILFWFIYLKLKKNDFKEFATKTLVLISGLTTPILFTLVLFWLQGALEPYLKAAFLQNVGYLSSWRPADVAKPFFEQNAPLITRGVILLFGLIILFFSNKKVTKTFLFASTWLLFSLFAATLSERPYPHYLVQVVPGIAILVGILLASPKIEQSLTIIPLLLVSIAILKYNFWYYPSLPYYKNFVEFVSGQKSQEEYFSYFNNDVSRNYEITKFIVTSTHVDDKIFVWGDSPSLYALSNRLPPLRYVATYHIMDFSSSEEVLASLHKEHPALVIVLPSSPSFPDLQNFLQRDYLLIETIKGAHIWKELYPAISKLIR